MKNFFLSFFLILTATMFSQRKALDIDPTTGDSKIIVSDTSNVFNPNIINSKIKPPIDLYKIYTIDKDTVFLDTTLTIQKEYKFNMLRKDIFGLLPFANEGQAYNTLDFGLNKKTTFPDFGFKAKHFNYLEIDDIKYYSVPTPLTELYFKTVMEQGQSLDAFLTVNTKPNLNFSVAYKGIRSIGKYINNISSSGNFRFTTSYFTKDKRYSINAHFTGQDITNQENGGIKDTQLFKTSLDPYNERERLDVYFKDATSILKGNRFFIEHSFKLLKENSNNLYLTHQFNHEYKFFNFEQTTANTRFGNSFTTKINNKTRYNHLYNKLGVSFQTKNLGNLEFFLDDNKYNYFYKSVVFDLLGNIAVPNSINNRINNIGGNYKFSLNKFSTNLTVSNSISNQSISDIEVNMSYVLNDDYNVNFQYKKQNSLPALNYTLYQSSYIDYNWNNNFNNEKLNQFNVDVNSKWVNLSMNYKIINDYLYFENENNDISLLKVKPKQFQTTINYFSIQASKEFKYKKFALDNTILYQNVEQATNVLNIPQITTRNTIYFTDKVFKKAMEIQTGVTFNYFTKYYINDYNPLLGEFFTQTQTKVGNFPMLDFFINAKVRQTRIFLKAEHFNSAWTGYNFYSAPNYPYRDFIVRFGLVWNFFQ